MSLWQIILLGLLQGLTEFLPISSTAHLRVVPALLGWSDPGAAITAILQLGSLLAVLVYFRKECAQLFSTGFEVIRGKSSSPRETRLFWAIVIGTVPIGILGYTLRHWVKNEARSLWVIAASLIAVGILIWVAEKLASLSRTEGDIRASDGFWVGLAQSTALIPGVSRSGSSICAGLFLGLNRETAARFSFLLGMPALFAAGVFELWEIRHELSGNNGLFLIVGAVAAFASSYLTIDGLLKFLRTRTNLPFVVYRILLGLVLVFLLWKGILQPMG